jgi:transcriptional regulator with XRE-family HTH domain
MVIHPPIPVLVKYLRECLGLTQEQFAHEVGVTFSTVNQWENGRRRPQPFLLKRLLQMKASLDKVPTPRLTKAQAQAFQQRWQAVQVAEDEELVSTPVTEKFRQLTGLLAAAQQLGWHEELAAEEDEVRHRWARLRQVLYG